MKNIIGIAILFTLLLWCGEAASKKNQKPQVCRIVQQQHTASNMF